MAPTARAGVSPYPPQSMPSGDYKITWDYSADETLTASYSYPPDTGGGYSENGTWHSTWSGEGIAHYDAAAGSTTTLSVSNTHYAGSWQLAEADTKDPSLYCPGVSPSELSSSFVNESGSLTNGDQYQPTDTSLQMFRFDQGQSNPADIRVPMRSEFYDIAAYGDPRRASLNQNETEIDTFCDGSTTTQAYPPPSSLPIPSQPAWCGPVDVPHVSGDTSGTKYSLNYQGTTTQPVYGKNGQEDGQYVVDCNIQTRVEPAVANQAPVVSAGDAVTGHSQQTLSLNGSATDDGLPNPPGQLTTNWSVVSAPSGGNVIFADASAPSTTAKFSRPGHYVLKLTASDSALSASAMTTADITDTYTISVRSWIPQIAVVDPVEPFSLSYHASEMLEFADPNCFVPPNSLIAHTVVSSTFHGDGHAGFDGGYRMQDIVTFDWDGQNLSNFQTIANIVHVGTTIRNKVYTDSRDGTLLDLCSQTGVAADTTSASSSGNTFTIQYTGKNPLTLPQALTPGFLNNLTGEIQADGSVDLNFQVTEFPSSGLQVLINDSPILTGLENDVSCLSDSAVLGVGGAVILTIGLLSTTAGSVAAVPNTDIIFGKRSPLCP
jgi:hypothetical protein